MFRSAGQGQSEEHLKFLKDSFSPTHLHVIVRMRKNYEESYVIFTFSFMF